MIALFNTLKWGAAVGGIVLLWLLCKPGLEKRYRAKWRYWQWLVLAMFLVLAPVPWSELLSKLSWFQPAVVLELPKAGGKELPERVAGEPAGTLLSAGAGNAVGYIPSDNLSEAGEDNSVGHIPPGKQFKEGTDDSFEMSPSENSKAVFPSSVDTGRLMRMLSIVLPVVWLSGVLLFLIWNLYKNLVFSRKLRCCTEAGELVQNMYREISAQMGIARAPKLEVCPQVDSPMLVGLFCPRLLLPEEDYRAQELSFILRHELTHYRRHDLWYKLVLLAANALHWFNPLIWLMVREANRDLELTCDDAVVAGEPMEVRRAYSETLFACLHRQQKKRDAHSALSTYFRGGTKIMKARFRNILDEGKRRGGALVLILALTLTMAAGCGVRVEGQNIVAGGAGFGGQGEDPQGQLDTVAGNGKIEGDGGGGSEAVGEDKSLLTRSHDNDGKLYLMVCPTEKLLEAGDGWWCYTPENQTAWVDAWETACAKMVRDAGDVPLERTRGIEIVYEGQYLYLMESQDMIMRMWDDELGAYWGMIAADDSTALRGLCEEAAREIGLSEPVRSEQIQGIQKATLNWNGEDIVLTDTGSLAKLEAWLSGSKYLFGGTNCWFTAGLTLELEDGRTFALAMATDSCCTWVSEGVFYKYDGKAYRNDGGSDNKRFYELFGVDPDAYFRTL